LWIARSKWLFAESETEGFPELYLAKGHLPLAMSGTAGIQVI